MYSLDSKEEYLFPARPYSPEAAEEANTPDRFTATSPIWYTPGQP